MALLNSRLSVLSVFLTKSVLSKLNTTVNIKIADMHHSTTLMITYLD